MYACECVHAYTGHNPCHWCTVCLTYTSLSSITVILMFVAVITTEATIPGWFGGLVCSDYV